MEGDMARKMNQVIGPSLKQEREWRAESDLRTLREAEAIRADPSRVRYAQKIAQKEMKALERVAGKTTPKGKR